MRAWLESKLLAMSGTDYLLLMIFMAAGIGFLVYFCFGAFRRFRYVDGTATSKIRSAAQGLVELKGLGEWLPGGSITSPFSGSRCIWYHCTIDKRQRSGKRTTWTNISDECSEHLFRLVDDTGWCVINPERAHVIEESDVTWYGSSTEQRARPPKPSALMKLAVSIGGGNYRFRERLIRPATSMYALGEFSSFQHTPSDELIARQAEDLVRQWKLQPQRYLRQFDLDGNGKIQKNEWKAIRAAARREVLAKMNQQDSEHHLLQKPRNGKQPFILSAVPEEDLVARKKLTAYLSVAIAFALVVTVVVMYSIRAPFPI